MNINVIVFNLQNGVQPPYTRGWGKGRQDEFSRTSVAPGSCAPVEEVIELTPQNGVWVGEKESRDDRNIAYGDAGGRQKMLSFSSVTTYDQNGRLNQSVQGKGLRIDIVA
jgi:hypothetical protein